MPDFLTANALLECSFGAAPCALVVPPLPGRPLVNGMPVAAVTDTTVMNIPTFGMCSSLANPEVASATAAAMGALTPMPCVPVIPAPWEPPSLPTTVAGLPAALATSKCLCAYGGVVSVTLEPNFFATG